ncbi:MAG: hypothetical protein GWN34_19890 [Gammaproteobacteria bacterium]|nr:hypothetical protein [Gammaproteobacteria bacterium]
MSNAAQAAAAAGRITGVAACARPPALFGFCIDEPVPGVTLTSYELVVRGWVLGRESAVTTVELLDTSLDKVIRRAEVGQRRDDVAPHFPGVADAARSGFRVAVGLLGLQPQAALDVVAVTENGARVALARIDIDRHPLQTGYRPQLNPLMVSSLGRCGSTWLMRLLARHPAVVVHERHPFEARLSKYFVHNVLKALAEPSEYLSTAEPDELYAANCAWLTHELVHDAELHGELRKHYIERLAGFCQQEIDRSYGRLDERRTLPERVEVARFFAEKYGPGHNPRLMWELYPQAREIILVRDFRDMFCSVRAFNARRGVRDFGLQEARCEREAVDATARRAASLLKSVASRRQPVHVLRYEDLVTEPEATLAAVLAYAGLSHDTARIRDMLNSAGQGQGDHATSASVAESLGRWRRELDPTLQAYCTAALGKALGAFGYETQ